MHVSGENCNFPKVQSVDRLYIVNCSVDFPELGQCNQGIQIKYLDLAQGIGVFNFPKLEYTPGLQVKSRDDFNLRLDISLLQTWRIDQKKYSIPKNISVIHQDKNAFRMSVAREYGATNDMHPEDKVYANKGEFIIRNPGKFWDIR
jgi:hypothetical protein